MTDRPELPDRPPFALRALLLTPISGGDSRFEADALVEVDAGGRITAVRSWADRDAPRSVIDARPWLLLPGLVDLHAHLPQIPNAGLGAGLDLLTWLNRYIFPLERAFDRAAAERLAPAAFRAFAAAGTTTVVAYGAVWPDSLDACFEAAEAHGIRAVIGKVMMDRLTYDEAIAPGEILDLSLRQSAELCGRWHGRDGGRLRYAFTPRFAVSCTAELLSESARLAAETGAYWQTHLSEDGEEVGEVRRLFPAARDYLDVYDLAGGLGTRTILAHANHLSPREITRLAESGSHVAHCPASNLFLGSGNMPLGHYLDEGVSVGLGSDVAGGPELSLFGVMRAGAYTQNSLGPIGRRRPALDPLGWLRLATLAGATALGLQEEIGSIETGKDADLILVDPELTAPLPGVDASEPSEVMGRLIFRPHPAMVRGAWVRGRRLPADHARA
ncbi:MAG: amidohydrolase family protein [Chloroflexota bacterium]|nr:amidohydrolase family protein [Chloroflexota bacterium]